MGYTQSDFTTPTPTAMTLAWLENRIFQLLLANMHMDEMALATAFPNHPFFPPTPQTAVGG